MKRRWRLVVGMLVSLVFLVLAMRGIDWAELWDAFRAANYWFLIPAFLLLIAINWARAYRWRLLMYPDTHLPLLHIFRIVNIGYLFNNVLPAKAGELVRAWLVGREIEGGIGQAASTILIERLLDVLTSVVILVILLPFIELPEIVTQAGLLLGVVSAVGTVVLIVLSRVGEAGLDWVWRLVGRIPVVGSPKVKALFQNLLNGFRVLTNVKLVPGILLGSAAVWFGYALFNYTLLAAFRMTTLPFAAAALVLCATAFIMVIPSSPGAMGVFEWAAVQALAVYGVAEAQAFGYALGLHTYTNLVLILFGLVGMLRAGLDYASIRSHVDAETALDVAEETPTH